MNDFDLNEEVKEALNWEPALDARAINISVKDGIVTLTGSVSSYPERHAAEKAAGLVRGVKAVACELHVTLPALSARSDQEIARAAADAIRWNTLLGNADIQVFVDKARVTLEGTVNWNYQRQSADRSVRYLAGVRDVNNHRPDRGCFDSKRAPGCRKNSRGRPRQSRNSQRHGAVMD